MDPLDKKMIVIHNVDNGYMVTVYEGPSGTPAVKSLIAKTWGDVCAQIQSLDMSASSDIDNYLRETFDFKRPEPDRPL
jgi:hypothetical protein